MPFAKALPPGTFSFACQKRTRKAPATFEAREARTRGCSPLVTPKLLGSIQKIQVASLKDFLCSADWKPLSRCATAPSKREPLAKPESVMVCPETLPLCQGLSLWESWQARQGLTERASPLTGHQRRPPKRQSSQTARAGQSGCRSYSTGFMLAGSSTAPG